MCLGKAGLQVGVNWRGRQGIRRGYIGPHLHPHFRPTLLNKGKVTSYLELQKALMSASLPGSCLPTAA